MYPCHFYLEPAIPLEHLSLILSTDLGMWWVDHLDASYWHLSVTEEVEGKGEAYF